MQVVSRETLYEQVWARPMLKVAADYGVTGTALKKTCDRHDIPTPERGYWAKLAHGKRVRQAPLPKAAGGGGGKVRIVGRPRADLPDVVREAGDKARQVAAELKAAAPPPPEPEVGDHKALAATRKAITKARPDAEGFVMAKGQGAVALKIAPASIDRAMALLSRLLRLAEAQGHGSKAGEGGLKLEVGGEPIGFGLEERPSQSPHTPTEKELKRKAENERWGYGSTTPWPKYDHAPSGRLAIVLQGNEYSGLRRTWSDHKVRRLEDQLADVLAGFAEHAALTQETDRKRREAARLAAIAEARRRREAAFAVREKRRTEFVGAVAEALGERARLSAVLEHFNGAAAEGGSALAPMVAWLRLRLKQLDALLSPDFVEVSARSAEVEFDELKAAAGPNGASEHRYYSRPAALQYWWLDKAENWWRGRSAIEWSVEAGHLPPFADGDEGEAGEAE